MSLIKREDAIERIKPMVGEWTDNGFMVSYERVLSILKDIPSADKQGEWIVHFDDLFPEESTEECSICHAEQMINGNDDNFCPNCGARMKGADDESVDSN